MLKSKIFENGLRLIVKDMPGLFSVSLAVMVGVGSGLENEKNNGISHVIEHMLFKGTKKRTSFEISEFVDKIGGQINAFTSKDTTCYYTRTASEYLEDCFDLISDMMFNSAFNEDEFEREKNVIIEEITMGEDTPDDVCHDLIAEAYFGSNPLGKTIIGTADIIRSLTPDDLRNFMKEYYNPSNVVISIAGNVKYDEAVKLAEKYFSKHFKNTAKSFKVPVTKPQSKFLFSLKEIEQAHLAFAFPSVAINEELQIPVNIFSYVLGGGMSSRLFQSIREKNGMAYTVFSYVSTYASTGYFEIYLGTNPNNIKKVCKLLKEELENILKDGITDDEFIRGKEQLKGGLVLSQESSLNIATSHGSYMLKTDKLYDIEDKLKQIENCTKKDVEKAIKFVLSVVPAATYVGREKNKVDLLELIK